MDEHNLTETAVQRKPSERCIKTSSMDRPLSRTVELSKPDERKESSDNEGQSKLLSSKTDTTLELNAHTGRDGPLKRHWEENITLGSMDIDVQSTPPKTDSKDQNHLSNVKENGEDVTNLSQHPKFTTNHCDSDIPNDLFLHNSFNPGADLGILDSQPESSQHEPGYPHDGGGGGDQAHSVGCFDPSESVKFQRMVLEVVEELHMRRAVDSENEDRIKQLMGEKHEIDTKYQESMATISDLKKMIELKVDQARRETLTKIQDLEEAKAKLHSTYESSEQNAKSLKDEIRALQLTNYTLEKRIREQERKCQVTAPAEDGHLTQIPALEMKQAAVAKRAEEVAAAYSTLEKNVKEAILLNGRLAYQNEHSACEVDRYRVEIRSLRTRIKEKKTESAHEPNKMQHQINLLETQVATFKKQIEKEKDASTSLRKQLGQSKSEQKLLGKRLSEAHSIIGQLTDQSKQAAEELEGFQQKLNKLNAQQHESTQRNNQLEASIEEERSKHAKEHSEMERRAEHSQQELEALRAAHQDLLKNHDELQQLNSAWAKKNVELSEEVNTLKAELEKPKCSVGLQTSVECVEADTQTEACVESVETQTVSSCLLTADGAAQTTYRATLCSTTQTVLLASLCTASQTQGMLFDDKNIQTSQEHPRESVQDPIADHEPEAIGKETMQAAEDLCPCSPIAISLGTLQSKGISQKQENHDLIINTDEQTLEKTTQRTNRLQLRSTKPPPEDNVEDLSQSDTVHRSRRFSFQFLHIPELEARTSSTSDDSTALSSTPEKVAPAAPSSEQLRGGIPSTSTACVTGGKRVAPSAAPIPGILSDPKASKSKRRKKVHFSTNTESDDQVTLLVEESDSDALFSEDEEEKDMELRSSQLCRIECALSEGEAKG